LTAIGVLIRLETMSRLSVIGAEPVAEGES
jgi:hypothetical protein